MITTSRNPSHLARFLPAGLFLAYLVGTVLIYFYGPWVYAMTGSRRPLVTFLVAVHVAFAAGYVLGSRGQPRASRFAMNVNTAVLLCVLLDLALLLPTSKLNTGSWIPHPITAMTDLGDAYKRSLALRDTGTPYINYVRMLLSPLLAASLPLAVFYWRHLRWLTRSLFGLSVLGMVATFTAMGANAGAAHVVALLPWFVLAGHLSGVQPIARRTWIVACVVQIAALALCAALFGATMLSRYGSYARSGFIPQIAQTRTFKPEDLTPASKRSALRVTFDGLASYVTQGYYAVYLSLQEPFVPSYGVGNSLFLQRQAARLTGDASLLERPYPHRLEKRGWNAYSHWATIYPWIASDVTFPGTIAVVLVIGWIFARVWLDVLGGKNPLAVAFFGQMLVMLYYFPAHNKTMQTGEGIVAFWVLLCAWLFSRRRLGAAAG